MLTTHSPFFSDFGSQRRQYERAHLAWRTRVHYPIDSPHWAERVRRAQERMIKRFQALPKATTTRATLA